MADKRIQIEKKVSIDANIAPILDYMLKKANTNLSGISNSFVRVWINQNLDLLSDSEKKKFKLS
jgi:hypothetical protein